MFAEGAGASAPELIGGYNSRVVRNPDPDNPVPGAEVYVNSRSVGVVWTPPYRVDISAAARPGVNKLKVEVINLLANRLIGDRAYPTGGRHTKSNIQAFWADSPLLPSGMLGPVRVFAE